MIQLYGINPIMEAMFYYHGRANDESIDKQLSEIIRRLPTQEEALEKAAVPAKTLKKLLDSKLDINSELVSKYFKNFKVEGADPSCMPACFCLAFIILLHPVMMNFEYSAEELENHLNECSMEERMYSLRYGITGKRETLFRSDNEADEFQKQLEKLPLSLEDKWKIQSAALNYRVHIAELFSLLKPAAALIKDALPEYDLAINDFRSIYSGDDAQKLLEASFTLKIGTADITKVVPMVLGFNRIFAIITLNDEFGKSIPDRASSEMRMFLGIARHIVKQTPHDEILLISDGMKALSDSTRLEILFYLCSHTAYGQELCTKFGLVRSALSYHITKLMDAGFVTGELMGSKTFYKTDKAGIQRMLDAFAEKIK